MAPTGAGEGAFPPTAWTLLGQAAAGGAGRARALDDLARRYWTPVYVYLRRTGRRAEDARDQAQSFFLHLLEGDLLARPDPALGRFRCWLRAVLEHFLANEARRAGAAKRGGGRAALALDADVEAGESAVRAGRELTPEEAFQRAWACGVLDRALARLEHELRAAGRAHVVAALRARLGATAGGGGGGGDAGGDAAAEAPAGAAPVDAVALHRARKRLKQLILDEVGDSVRDPDDLKSEVAELFRALGRNP